MGRMKKENIKIDAYVFVDRLKEYPKFDYRGAMMALHRSYQGSKGWELEEIQSGG